MTSAFIGGSVGSAVSGWLHGTAGWSGVTLFGAALPLLAAAIWVSDELRLRRSGAPGTRPGGIPAAQLAPQQTAPQQTEPSAQC